MSKSYKECAAENAATKQARKYPPSEEVAEERDDIEPLAVIIPEPKPEVEIEIDPVKDEREPENAPELGQEVSDEPFVPDDETVVKDAVAELPVGDFDVPPNPPGQMAEEIAAADAEKAAQAEDE